MEKKHWISTLHIPLFYTTNIYNATAWRCVVWENVLERLNIEQRTSDTSHPKTDSP